MALEINDINLSGGLSATTISATTIFVTAVTATNISTTTLSGETIFSGNTNLYSIFSPIGSGSSTYVQPGSNIITGGTAGSPTVNLVASPSIDNLSFSGTATGVALSATTISGGTLYSGSTNLYSIFSSIGSVFATGATYVQPGSNITTGGTQLLPIISIVDNPSFNNISFSGTATGAVLSATTISATTYYGNGENLTGVAHAFTGVTAINFDALISGETNYATTAITNSNINYYSTVNIIVSASTNHPSQEEALLEGLRFTQSDIVDGVGFTLNAYSPEGTWGVYNIIYRIIN